MLHGGVRQAEAMGGRLLRSGGQDSCNDPDLTVGGASGSVARALPRHALRSQSHGSGGSASRMMTERSVVAGQSFSPRPFLKT
jgi:hypothetical protein